MKPLQIFLLAMCAIALVIGSGAAVFAQDSFYSGKVVRIVVGYGPGSSYDGYARVISRFAGKHIPGNPSFVVENMPGAGSLSALNYLVNVAPQDGTVIGAIGATLPFGPLLGEQAARFDPLKLQWLPSPGTDTSCLAVWHTTPVRTLADARNTELILASNAITGSSSLYGRLLSEVLGLKIRLVYGYTGGVTDALLATERGEVNGHPSVSWSALKNHGAWLTDGVPEERPGAHDAARHGHSSKRFALARSPDKGLQLAAIEQSIDHVVDRRHLHLHPRLEQLGPVNGLRGLGHPVLEVGHLGVELGGVAANGA